MGIFDTIKGFFSRIIRREPKPELSESTEDEYRFTQKTEEPLPKFSTSTTSKPERRSTPIGPNISPSTRKTVSRPTKKVAPTPSGTELEKKFGIAKGASVTSLQEQIDPSGLARIAIPIPNTRIANQIDWTPYYVKMLAQKGVSESVAKQIIIGHKTREQILKERLMLVARFGGKNGGWAEVMVQGMLLEDSTTFSNIGVVGNEWTTETLRAHLESTFTGQNVRVNVQLQNSPEMMISLDMEFTFA